MNRDVKGLITFVIFQKFTLSYFEDPYHTNDSQLAQEWVKNKKWMKKHPIPTEIELLKFIRRPDSGCRSAKGLTWIDMIQIGLESRLDYLFKNIFYFL